MLKKIRENLGAIVFYIGLGILFIFLLNEFFYFLSQETYNVYSVEETK